MSWIYDQQKREQWVVFMQSLSPDIDPQKVRLIDEIGFVFRAIYQVGQQSLDAINLSYPQYRVLIQLFFAEKVYNQPQLNPSEISDRQGVSRNAVSSLIRNLEEAGLIERQLDPEDRRRFNISLTANGRSLVTDHARHHLTTIGNCFTSLSPDEQNTLSTLLHKVAIHTTAP